MGRHERFKKVSAFLLCSIVLSALILPVFPYGKQAFFSVVHAAETDSADQTDLPVNAGAEGTAAIAVDPIAHPGEYTAILYDNANGLPTSEANAIAQTSEGFIWIGAYSGLIRYDGNTFERMDSTTGVASVTVLYVDSSDRLWVGTNDNGIALVQNGGYTNFDKPDGLPSSGVRAIVEDRAGNIYIGTTDGMAVIDSDLNLCPMDNDLFANTYIQNLQVDRNGTVYGMCIDGEIFEARDGEIVSVKTSRELGFGNEVMLCMRPDPDRDGYFYFGGEFSKLYYGSITDGSRHFESIDVSPLNDITSIKAYGDDIWITAINGIGIIRNDRFYPVENLPMNNKIETQMLDYQGNLWFTSSRQGVMKIVRNQFTDIYEQYGLSSDTVNSTCILDGKLFIGSDTGLTVLSGDSALESLPVESFVTASGNPVEDAEVNDLIAYLSGTRIRSVIRDRHDRLWLSTWKSKGLLCYDGEKVICYTADDGLPSDRIRAVYDDGERILAACTGGVAVIKDGKVKEIHGADDGIRNLEVLTVTTAADGSIVLGTDGDGIYILKDGETLHVTAEDGLNSDIVMRIKRDPVRNIFWVVTSNCLAYMTEDYQAKMIEHFPYSNNFDLYENSDGELWILASNGLYVAKADDMLENGEFPVTHYGTGDGLAHIATSNSYSELTADGDLYISGISGVVKVNINGSVYDDDVLKLALPYIIADGKTVFPDPDGSFTIDKSVNKLTIQGRAFIYTLDNPRISYYLDGFDEEPVTVNRNEMTAHDYTNLAGGTYRFVMEVQNQSGETAGTLSVEIRKDYAFYETIWFHILMYVLPAIIVGGIAIVYFRFRAIREKKRREMELKYRKAGLSGMLELYSVIYIIDLDEDTITPVGMDEDADSERPKDLSPNDQLFNLFREDATDTYREIMLSFIDLETIRDRMTKRNHLVIEYESRNYGWSRVQYIGMDRKPDEPVGKLLFTVQQINDEKEELDRIKGQVTKAESENKAKSVFLANMSHEIRTPINAILGLDTMIMRESKEDGIRAYARDIKSAGSMLLSLINSVLDFSKLEAGKMELNPAEYSLRELIADVRTIIRPRFDESGLAFELDVTESIPDRLFGDDVRLKQILINLLTNAVKYTDEGTVTLRIYGKRLDGETEHLLFSIKDTGTGIRAEDRKKLTERFSRIDEGSRNRNVEGTGIGINLVTGLLELMGSELKVASVYEDGSDFYFEVEQKVMSDEPVGKLDAPEEEAEDTEYQASFSAPDAHLLIVDDTDINRTVFIDLLKETEVNIDEASSGEAALALTKENRYDIIFMDHMMPQMDGVETLQHIREQSDGKNNQTPVIALTANAFAGAAKEYADMGFDDFMGKPMSPDVLEEKIIAFLPEDLCKVNPRTGDRASSREEEKLPEIDGVDPIYALQHVGSRDGVLNVMKQLVKVSGLDSDELRGYYDRLSADRDDNEALSSYRIKVHAMKSSASLCGALQVYGMAARLEQAAIRGSIDEILTVTPYFLEAWHELTEAMKTALPVSDDEGEEKEVVKDDVLKGLLHQLVTAMDSYDIKGADSIIAELEKYSMTDQNRERFERLKAAVAALDADTCKTICGEMTDE